MPVKLSKWTVSLSTPKQKPPNRSNAKPFAGIGRFRTTHHHPRHRSKTKLPTTPNIGGRYVSRDEMEATKQIHDGDNIEKKIRAFWFPPYDGAYVKNQRSEIHPDQSPTAGRNRPKGLQPVFFAGKNKCLIHHSPPWQALLKKKPMPFPKSYCPTKSTTGQVRNVAFEKEFAAFCRHSIRQSPLPTVHWLWT